MSDADVVCYANNYPDTTADQARDEYMSLGWYEGRQPNCAKNLTNYEAQNFINRYPYMQH